MSDDYLLEIQETFLAEAMENLAQTESLFMALEKPDTNHQDAFDKLKRLAHNFKGSGKAVGFDDLSSFCHSFENLLIGLSQNSIELNGESIDLLLRCNDALKINIEALQANKSALMDHTGLILEIEGKIDGNLGAAVIQKEFLNHVTAAVSTKEDYIRIPMKRIEDLFNAFGEQVILMSALDHLREDLCKNKDELERTVFNLKKITSDLQQSTLSLRMVNLKGLYAKLERAIRDVSKITNKTVRCDFIGIEQELDKAIVDQISDALTHMVRNSVDHGLESTVDRILEGKPEEGVVGIKSFREAGNFIIEIYDDGKGLDPDRILKKAIENGLIKEGQELKEKEIFDLIFENGFSTKDVASEISGRGIGMNVVKEVIQSLGGTYEIFSKVGKGTKFRMKLPLSLSLFNGMCFMNQGQRYVVPSSQVIEIMNTDGLEIRDTEKNQQVVQIRQDINSVIDLRNILIPKIKPNIIEGKKRDMVLIADLDGEKACFRVEQITGIVRVVQKPLSPDMSHCPGSVGVTILGDGNPALILDLRVLWANLKIKNAEVA